MSELLDTQYKESRLRRLAMGLGGFVVCIGIAGAAYNAYEVHSADARTAVTSIDTPDESVTPTISSAPSITPSTVETIPSQETIDKNIAESHVTSVDLFGDGQNKVHTYLVPVENGAGDFTPQEKDGIFFASVAYDDPALPRPYHFGDTLATDAKGNITGDLLIQGHTNSGGDWIMNKAGSLKVGDTQQLHFGDAIYTTEITKITTIKKTGASNFWPGFAEALGPNGAIETCKLGVDANGNTIQSGYITVYAIKIIAAKKVA